MNADVTRIAVIGAGIMGANHARVAHQLANVSLAAIVDQDHDRALRLAEGSGAIVTDDVQAILDDIDLAVVAVPTPAHHDISMLLLEAGKSVLVEKPIASSPDEARDMIASAMRRKSVLAVGHIERFNAAVTELPGLLCDPIHIRAVRVSPYSPRISDGVIHDLMIHDLDIVLSLVGPDVAVSNTSGSARTIRGPSEDLANANVAFDNGLTASFETSRLGQQKVRQIQITQAESVIVADLVRQDITVYRMSRHEYLADDGVRYRQSSVVEIPFIDQRGEPLHRELADVIAAVRSGSTPRVSGHDGLRALLLADQIADSVVRS